MRRRKAPKRETGFDPKYNSEIVNHFIKITMREGKKTLAQRLIYDAFAIVEEKIKQDAVKVFFDALENARPRVQVKPRRIGGATYQVPIEVSKDKGMNVALCWIRDAARNKKGKPMSNKLADEIIAAYKYEGTVVKKKEDTHKMAESNRAFAHFRV